MISDRSSLIALQLPLVMDSHPSKFALHEAAREGKSKYIVGRKWVDADDVLQRKLLSPFSM